MRKIRIVLGLAACTTAMATASAAPVSLDLTSGIFSNPASGAWRTYTESGFILQLQRPTDHMDPGFIGDIGFHNGPTNGDDVRWRLTFMNVLLPDGSCDPTGCPPIFDLIDIDVAGFLNMASSFTMTGSNGQTQTVSSVGVIPALFRGVTYVEFNIDQDGGIESVGLSGITVDSESVPEPDSLVLLGMGLAGLAALARRNA